LHDLRHGTGIFTYPNGEKYDGNFTNGEKSGFGRFEFPGGFYEGHWEAGRYHGRGRLSVRGETLDGMFRDGSFVGTIDGDSEEAGTAMNAIADTDGEIGGGQDAVNVKETDLIESNETPVAQGKNA